MSQTKIENQTQIGHELWPDKVQKENWTHTVRGDVPKPRNQRKIKDGQKKEKIKRTKTKKLFVV
jgi:hypothetical protein